MSNRKTWPVSLSVSTPTRERFCELAQAGIHCAELTMGCTIKGYEAYDFLNRSREIATMALECGVRISSLHLPFDPFERLDLTTEDAAERAWILQYQKDLITACGKACIPIAVIHPSIEPNPEEQRPEILERAISFLSELAEHAVTCNVKLAIENLPRTCLGRDSYDMRTMLERIPLAYACFDTNHSLQEDNLVLVRAMGNRIVGLHVSDYDGIDERHRLPFDGINDWKGILSALEELGFDGVFNYEVGAPGLEGAQAVKANYDQLMQL